MAALCCSLRGAARRGVTRAGSPPRANRRAIHHPPRAQAGDLGAPRCNPVWGKPMGRHLVCAHARSCGALGVCRGHIAQSQTHAQAQTHACLGSIPGDRLKQMRAPLRCTCKHAWRLRRGPAGQGRASCMKRTRHTRSMHSTQHARAAAAPPIAAAGPRPRLGPPSWGAITTWAGAGAYIRGGYIRHTQITLPQGGRRRCGLAAGSQHLAANTIALRVVRASSPPSQAAPASPASVGKAERASPARLQRRPVPAPGGERPCACSSSAGDWHSPVLGKGSGRSGARGAVALPCSMLRRAAP